MTEMDQTLQLTMELLKELKTDMTTGQDKMQNSISAIEEKMSTCQKEIERDIKCHEFCSQEESQNKITAIQDKISTDIHAIRSSQAEVEGKSDTRQTAEWCQSRC
jgi:BMFP domain-containing protein YqiC